MTSEITPERPITRVRHLHAQLAGARLAGDLRAAEAVLDELVRDELTLATDERDRLWAEESGGIEPAEFDHTKAKRTHDD